MKKLLCRVFGHEWIIDRAEFYTDTIPRWVVDPAPWWVDPTERAFISTSRTRRIVHEKHCGRCGEVG